MIVRNFTLAIALLAFFNISAQRSNCQAYPYPNTLSQPDGSKITLVGLGNEAIHYTETMEGYTVLQTKSGFFEYASLDATGSLVASGVRAAETVSKAALGKTSFEKHLRYSPAQQKILLEYFAKLQEKAPLGKAAPNVFPSTGNRKVIVLLIEYPDLKAVYPKSSYELLFNQPNYNNTGSFKDFHQKSSYGQLNMTADLYGWYMAQNIHTFYPSKARTLLQEAIVAADSAVDFKQYDTDADGYVDAVMVIHSGIGAEETSAPNSTEYIWSFRSTWNSSPTYDSVKFSAYAMFPEKRYSGGAYPIVGIGVITHEFGHILDMPDLYATNYNNTGGGPQGVGNFAVMGGGGWLNGEKTPCMHDAWTKIQLGWLKPDTLKTEGSYTILKGSADSNFAYYIPTPRANEYFLLENRTQKGFDMYLPTQGMAVWHINTNYAKKLSAGGGNNVNNDTSNLGLGLMQADGFSHLEKGTNRGDAGDLFPGTSTNRNFTPYTNPSSNLYYKVGGVKQPSNVSLTAITRIPSNGAITFNFGATAVAAFNPSAIKGCAPMVVNFANVSTFADNYQWDFGDGNTSTLQSPAHTYNNIGTYRALLLIYKSGLMVDSVSQTISVSESPKAQFTVARGDSNNFTLSSTSLGVDYVKWQIGTNQSSYNPNLSVKLTGTGKTPFYLVAYSPNGCTDTVKSELEIWSVGLNTLPNQFTDASIYPNPFSQKLQLSFSLNSAAELTLRLVDVLGNNISKQTENLASGKHQLDLSQLATTLSKGVYFLRLENNDTTKTFKLIKTD